jgi:hypothetical protein
MTMKKIGLLLVFIYSLVYVNGQCIDVLISTSNDTIYGRLLDTSNNVYTFDSYNYVFAIKKEMVKTYIPCYRQANKEDLLRMKHIDKLSGSDLLSYTPGYYLRKSTTNFYLGICLLSGGIAANNLALTYFHQNYEKSEWIVFAAGTIASAGGLFFLLRSFYFVDKAGKLMDLERSSIYLEPTPDGHIGLKWKF